MLRSATGILASGDGLLYSAAGVVYSGGRGRRREGAGQQRRGGGDFEWRHSRVYRGRDSLRPWTHYYHRRGREGETIGRRLGFAASRGRAVAACGRGRGGAGDAGE